jgi:hypothetical protein
VGFGDVGDDGQAETEPVRAGGPVRTARWKGSSRRLTWSGGTGGPVLVTVSVASVVLAASLTSIVRR